MKANYHTHTWRCNHASGTEEEYVQHALKRGLHTLGFADHTPYFFQQDYYSSFRMRPELLRDYTDTLAVLKAKYEGNIRIHIGLEAEYYPMYFQETLSFLQDHPLDYLILGQHFAGNEPFCKYSGAPTLDSEVLKEYCRTVMDAMQTGLFTYLAHPDLINYIGSLRTYRENMGAVIREAKSCGIPLEINLLGLTEHRHYPSRRLLELAAEENCPMILGIDAHKPEALSDPGPEQKALAMAAEYGIVILEDISLRPIR